jgi:hypothetical protein
MTVDDFKKEKPELAHLEGDMLLNAMEEYMLRQQDGYRITKVVLPFWKRYTFRWIYYRKTKNWVFGKNDRSATNRCTKCKKPVSSFMGMGGKMYCPYGGHELKQEPNTNFDHKMYLIEQKIVNWLWLSLDWIHLVRYGHNERYGFFGDESAHVHHIEMNFETGKTKCVLKKRKWWQHIFVERKFKPTFK